MKTWWGYKGIDKVFHVKAFKCFNDIHDAYASGKAIRCAGPFPAKNQKAAMTMLRRRIKASLKMYPV